MQTILIVDKTDKDGILSLRLPLGQSGVEYEVVIVAQPTGSSPEKRGWPPGYFNLAGSIDDETFVLHPQPELPPPVEIE